MRVLISSLFFDLSPSTFLPYVYGLLRSFCDEDEYLKENLTWERPLYTLDLMDELVLDKYMDQLKEPPDILGISCYSWNTNFQIFIAKKMKQRFPNLKVVMGGPNSPKPDHELEQFFKKHCHVDFIIHGEGELTFALLMKALLQGDELSEIPNLSCHGLGYTYFKARDPQVMNTGSPFLKGYFEEIIDEIRSEGKEIQALWETNRGCPYSCTFCDWGSATMAKVKPFDQERIFKEIDWFSRNNISSLYSCDANFGIFPFDEEIASYLSQLKAKTSYPKEVWFTFAKSSPKRVEKISRIFTDNGLMRNGVTVSVQSMHEDTLKAVKRKNLKRDDYKRIVENFHSKNTPIYSEVLLGLPEETYDTFVDGLYKLMEMGVHESIRFYNVDVLPNSQLAEPKYREKYGIESIPVEQYNDIGILANPEAKDGSNFITSTKTFSRDDIAKAHVRALVVQLLHCIGFTRYLAIYYYKEKNTSYSEFYESLITHFSKKEGSELFKILNKFQEEVRELYESKPHELANRAIWKNEVMNFKGQEQEVPGRVIFRAYIQLLLVKSDFYFELRQFLKQRGSLSSFQERDVLKFQEDVMIDLSYQKDRGKKCFYLYDLYSYFKNYKTESAPRFSPCFIKFQDRAMGPGKNKEIDNSTLRSFLETVGHGGRLLPQFYVHQLSKAKTRFFLKPKEKYYIHEAQHGLSNV